MTKEATAPTDARAAALLFAIMAYIISVIQQRKPVILLVPATIAERISKRTTRCKPADSFGLTRLVLSILGIRHNINRNMASANTSRWRSHVVRRTEIWRITPPARMRLLGDPSPSSDLPTQNKDADKAPKITIAAPTTVS